MISQYWEAEVTSQHAATLEGSPTGHRCAEMLMLMPSAREAAGQDLGQQTTWTVMSCCKQPLPLTPMSPTTSPLFRCARSSNSSGSTETATRCFFCKNRLTVHFSPCSVQCPCPSLGVSLCLNVRVPQAQ